MGVKMKVVDIERVIGVLLFEMVLVYFMCFLYEVCWCMFKMRVRRILLVDWDDEMGREMVVSVIM